MPRAGCELAARSPDPGRTCASAAYRRNEPAPTVSRTMRTDAQQPVRPAPPATPARAGGRWSPPWPAVAVGVVALALVVTDGLRQAVTPYLRRDDWPYLLPPHTPGIPDVHAKNLLEGRWLNEAWWHVVGQHSTPTSAALTYAAAYALFVVGLWRVLRLSGIRAWWPLDALLGLALFSSAVWVRLLYWPGTLTPSMLVAAVGVWTLPLTRRSPRRAGVWVAVWVAATTVLSVLTYPPVGAVLFLAAVVWLREARIRHLLLLCGTYLVAFAVGIGVIYTLNWFAFGHFGVEIAAWRHPNPLTGVHDLVVNAARFKRALLRLVVPLWPAVVVGAAAAVVGWFDAAVRPRLVRFALGVAVVVGLEAAQTLATGVVTDDRGQLWAWFTALVPAALLLRASPPRRWVGAAGLAVLAVVGVLAWRADIGAHQATREQYAAIATEATRPLADGSRRPVVVYQPPDVRATSAGGIMAASLRLTVREAAGGVMPRWCRGSECTRLAALPPGQYVLDLGSVVGVVVPPVPPWL
jgi:hypothetical protein